MKCKVCGVEIDHDHMENLEIVRNTPNGSDVKIYLCDDIRCILRWIANTITESGE